MNALPFFFCLFSLVPVEQAYVDKVDIVEINSFYDESGRLVFDQILFWEYGFIREWRLMKDGRESLSEDALIEAKRKDLEQFLKDNNLKELPKDFTLHYIPKWIGSSKYHFDFINKCVTFTDGNIIIYKIYFTTLVHTHTQYDPELVNREYLPKEHRTPFRGPTKNVPFGP